MTYKYGIDFGTTNTSIAIALPGKGQTCRPNVLLLDSGNMWGPAELLRSVFYVDASGKIHIGEDADNTMDAEEYQGIFSEGRYRSQIKMDLADGKTVLIRGNGFAYRAVDLLTALFKRLKEKADEFASNKGISLCGAVMGVPLSFTEESKRLYMEALCNAGYYCNMESAMKETEFVSEPAAVAVHYGEKLTENKRVMVFDYGGGTLDVSVVDLREQIGKNDKLHPHEVIGIATGYNIGGERINKEFFVNFFVSAYGLQSIKSFLGISDRGITTPEKLWEAMRYKYAGIRFIQQIDRCKRELTTSDTSTFVPPIEIQTTGKTLKSLTVSRTEFEEAVECVFIEVDKVVRSCLDQCLSHVPPIRPNQISEVLIAGGSSLIPRVKDILAKYFVDRSKIGRNAEQQLLPEKEVLESIVRGLSIVGCKDSTVVSDVLDCAYGVWDVQKNRFSEIIPCGTKISAVEADEFEDRAGLSRKYRASDSSANEMEIKIVQRVVGINNNHDKILKEVQIDIGGQYGTEFEFFLSIDKKLKMLILKVYSEKKKTFYYIPRESSQISIKI